MAILKRVKDGNKVGYIDAEGKLVFDYQFDNGVDSFGTDSFHATPYATIQIDGLCGIIHENGSAIIPADYDDAFHLFGDFFAIRKALPSIDEFGHQTYSYKMGVINKELDIIIPFEFQYISSKGSFFECYAEAGCVDNTISSQGRKHDYHPIGDACIYDSVGTLINKGTIRAAGKDFFILEVDRKVGVCNAKGEIIIPQIYRNIECCGNDRFIAEIDDGEDWSFVILDNNNSRVNEEDFKYIKSREGIFFECYSQAERIQSFNRAVQYTNLSMAIWLNATGQELHRGEADVISSQYLRVKNANKWGVIDNLAPIQVNSATRV